MVDHLNLVMVFPVPLAVYLAIRRTEGSLSPIAFVGLLTADLLFLFGVVDGGLRDDRVVRADRVRAGARVRRAASGGPVPNGAVDRRRLPDHRAALAALPDRGLAQPTDRGPPPGRSDRGRPRGLGGAARAHLDRRRTVPVDHAALLRRGRGGRRLHRDRGARGAGRLCHHRASAPEHLGAAELRRHRRDPVDGARCCTSSAIRRSRCPGTCSPTCRCCSTRRRSVCRCTRPSR